MFSRLCCLRVVCLEVARPDVIVRVYLITHEDRLDAETYGVMTLENRMATFFNSQVWCSMKPLSITRARNTVQLPVLEPYMYSRLETNMPITARIGYALTAILSFKEYGGITIGPDLLAQEALLAQLARASRFHRLWSAQPIGSQPP